MKGRGVVDWAVEHFKPAMLVIWGSIALCIIISIIVSNVSNASPNATILNISVAPTSARITLDGAETRNGSYRVSPGVHHIEASADGFESRAIDIDVKSNETNNAAFYLINRELGLKYYERSVVEINLMRVIANNDDAAKEFIDAYDLKYDLIVDVPFSVEYETPDGFASMRFLDGRDDSRCKSTLCILVRGHKVDDSSFYGEVADELLSRGYDVEDYEVIYDYE